MLQQRLVLWLYVRDFVIQHATPPPLLERSNLIRSYSSISSSLFKIDGSSLDSLIPIIEAVDCFAIKRI